MLRKSNMEAAKEAFPSPIEAEVASALLLLSSNFTMHPSLTLSPPLEKGYGKKMENEVMKKKLKLKLKLKLKKKSSNSKSEWSGSTSSTVTTENDQRLKVIDVVSKFHDMLKLKVVRKRRSKSLCMSNCQKISSGKQAVKVEPSASVSASSCLSSGSSSVISTAASSGSVINRRGNYLFHTLAKEAKKKPVFGSTHMRRRAEAILKVLSSHGRASEVKIRELLGDSPSTSKALRILLNLEQVKRTGAGGRTDPYIYMIA